MALVTGEKCKTCYGEGNIATETGPSPCPDCGGDGRMPHGDTLVEWRLRALEQTYGQAGDELAKDLNWLAFELRRARAALTEIITLANDAEDPVALTRLRFVANRALGLYEVTDTLKKDTSAGQGD